MTIEDLETSLKVLNGAMVERLQTARNATYRMIGVNFVNFAGFLMLDTLAYLGVKNGGCNTDTKDDLAASYAQQPLPATIFAGLALVSNLYFAFKQDANNHFTEIALDAVIKILQATLKEINDLT